MPWFKLDLQSQLKGSVTMRRPGNEKQGLGVHGLAFLGLLETTRAARREERQAESQEQANGLGSIWLDPLSQVDYPEGPPADGESSAQQVQPGQAGLAWCGQ